MLAIARNTLIFFSAGLIFQLVACGSSETEIQTRAEVAVTNQVIQGE
tara:strand:+ start:426 stop:566 length:141 start_codon:yes stop_codon:yes gene_type:complete